MPPKRRYASRVGLRRVTPKFGNNSMLTRGRPLYANDVEDNLAQSGLPDGSNAIPLQHRTLAGGEVGSMEAPADELSVLEVSSFAFAAGDDDDDVRNDSYGNDDVVSNDSSGNGDVLSGDSGADEGYNADDDDDINNNDQENSDCGSYDREPDIEGLDCGFFNPSFGSAYSEERYREANSPTRATAREYAKTLRAEDSSRGRGWFPKNSEESGTKCKLSASDFLALYLWCGPGHLSGRQYESARNAVETSVKTALSPCVEDVAAMTRQSLLERLVDERLIKADAVDEARRIAHHEMPNFDKAGIHMAKSASTTLTALPSLATMRRRMQSGGLYEELMLPCKVIRMKRMLKSSSAKSTPVTDEVSVREHAAAEIEGGGVGTRDQSDQEAASDNDDKWEIPATAGVVLPSAYIARDFAFFETYKAIISGVKGTKFWADSPPGSPAQFSSTDLATKPQSVLRPAAYGAEAPTGGQRWPDLFCEGSNLEISAIGFAGDGSPTRKKTMKIEVKAVQQPFIFESSNNVATSAYTNNAVSTNYIREKYGAKVRAGDLFWQVVKIEASEARGDNASEDPIGDFAALGFHWGNPRMRATLLCEGEVWCIEESKSKECPATWVQGTIAPSSVETDEQDSRSSWTDNSGTRCIRIHLALFSDDFHVRPNKSVGGVYFMYLTMPTDRRSGAQATRVISVAPVGGNSDVCVTAALHDFLRLESDGLICLDPYGVEVRVFARVALALADYVQIGHSTPCKGHNSLHPCTVCSQYRGDLGSAGYQSGRSTSADLSLMRSEKRYKSIATSAPQRADKMWGDVSIRADLVSRTIHEALRDADEAKKTCQHRERFYFRQTPFLSPMSVYSAGVGLHLFDVYLSYYGGIDHCLLLGIGKDTLDFLISSMQTIAARKDFEAIVLRLLRSNGYDRPGRILSSSAKAESPTTSMTVSELSAALSFLPAAISELCGPTRGAGKEPFTERVLPYIIRHMKATITLLTFVFCPARPDISTDAELETHKKRIKLGRKMAQELIDSARAARNSGIARFSNIEAKRLQKPNLHRVMEIMVRWLPSVGWNFAHLGELLFEKTHGYMKTAFSQTQPGVDEALRAMDRMRYRELVDRLLLESTPERAMSAGYPARDLLLSAEVCKDPRVLACLNRLQASGTRGFTVKKDCQFWSVTARGWAPGFEPQFSLGSLKSLISIRKVIDRSLPVVTENDAHWILAASARVSNTSVPHKSVAVGQVVTTLRRELEMPLREGWALAEDRVTLLIDSIATWVDLQSKNVVLCYGQVLTEVVSTQSTFGLRIMKKGQERVWVHLDGSSRRAAAAVATADGQVTPGRVSDARKTYLAVLLPGDGFPLRLA